MTGETTLSLGQGRFHDEPGQFAVAIHHERGRRLLEYTAVLRHVLHYAEPLAWRLSCQISRAGSATVWAGSREVAEFKRDRIREFALATDATSPPLLVSIERLARGETVTCPR